MKILHVVHGYPPSLGGSQVLVKHLSEHLARTYGDQVTVFTTNTYHTHQFRRPGGAMLPTGSQVINGVQVRRFPVFNRLSLLRIAASAVAYRLKLPGHDFFRTLENGPIMFGLKQAVAQSRAEVIFATAFPLLHMYQALSGAKQAGIPIVMLGALHTADVWGYDRAMIYQAIQQADAYIAHTPFERDYVIDKGCDPDKITLVGGGVNADPFLNADGQIIRQRYQLGNGPVIVTLGGQVARKRLDTLLAAMTIVWQTHPQAYLIIAGRQGNYTPQLKVLLAALPADQRRRVIVISDFADDEKAKILAAGDIFVLCSGEESFGIAFVEAWACGKPVVGANVGAVASLIEAGADGLLFEYSNSDSLAQAIESLLTQPAQRTALGTAGQQKVLQNYTWEIITERLRQVYRAVIEQSRR